MCQAQKYANKEKLHEIYSKLLSHCDVSTVSN